MAIKNILAVRNDRFGEFLLNIPALRALKETFGGSRLVLAVNPQVKELAQALGFIDEIIAWDNRRHTWSQILGFAGLARKSKFDLCVVLNPSRDANLVAFLAGIPVRLGYDRKWGFLLTHKIKDAKALGAKHEVEYNLELVGAIGASTRDTSINFPLTEAEIARAKEKFNLSAPDKIVAIHPWTSDPVKQWPQGNFYALTKKLLTRGGFRVVAVGGMEEVEKSSGIFKDMGERFINATGRTNLVELAALLKNCNLLISCDSGPAHLACAVRTPTIVIFRSDLPGKTAKRWGPWGQGHSVIEKEDLLAITAEEVFDKAREVLGT